MTEIELSEEESRALLADEGIDMHNVAKRFMRRTVHLCKEREQLKARIAELEAENARMRPVVSRARLWLKLLPRNREISATEVELAWALNEYARPVHKVVAEIGESIPDEELRELPSDLARNVDHYLYGAKKEGEANDR